MTSMTQFKLDEEKFRELVIYIAGQCETDPAFGAVKLNKLLYYADFAAYRQFGQPITGSMYRKLSEGPAPEQMVNQRDIMLDKGEATLEKRTYFTGIQHRLIPARPARKSLFRDEELDIANQVIAFFEGKTARDVSDFSHREPGWRLAQRGETIPYETAWLSPEPPGQSVEEKLEGFNA